MYPRFVIGLAATTIMLAASAWVASADLRRPGPPPWAYAVDPPVAAGAAPAADAVPKRVPGSALAFTHAQIKDLFKAPDWFPEDHPRMPEVVALGRKPAVLACGYCHLPNGQGRPENAALAGLPASYIKQQAFDISNGVRRTSGPLSAPHALMLSTAVSANEAELNAAAAYFSALRFKPWIRVVETATVPQTHVAGYMLVPLATGGVEAIGQRIVETPENLVRTELRDSRSGFIAYVPVGSVVKGEALVKTGGAGRTIPCGICHGADLKGLATVPAIAGRSPSYIVRQLYDMQAGTRHGVGSELMKEPVAKLTIDDMVAIAAYVAARAP